MFLNYKINFIVLKINNIFIKMTIDYQRYRSTYPRYTIKSTIHPSKCFSFICTTTKRLLKPRFMALRSCASVLNVRQRRALRLNFCKFAYNYYFVHFARLFNLNLRDKSVSIFFSQLFFWIGNAFSQKTAPDVFSRINSNEY